MTRSYIDGENFSTKLILAFPKLRFFNSCVFLLERYGDSPTALLNETGSISKIYRLMHYEFVSENPLGI